MKIFKKLLTCFVLTLSVLSLSGCGADVSNLNNPSGALNDVANRNIEVIEKLYIQGIIGETQFKGLQEAILLKASEYNYVLDKLYNPPDDISVSELKSNLDTIKKELMSSVVATFGYPSSDKSYAGVELRQCGCGLCESSLYLENSLIDYQVDDSLFSFEYLIKDDGSSLMTPKSDKDVVPLSFISDEMLSDLKDEVNKEIWVLNPDVVNKNNIVELIHMLDSAKKANNHDYLLEIASKYFMPSPYTAYAFDYSDLIVSSSYNDTMYSLAGDVKNEVNKDLILTGDLSVYKHVKIYNDTTKKYECDITSEIVDIAAYSIRVNEFNSEFINMVNNDVYTNDRYISITPNAKQSASRLLLMEYPVAVINSLKTSGAGNTDWEFGFEESPMRVNIYNGEMLIKNSNGEYIKINEEDDSEEKIYRVLPEAVGTNSDKGTTSSFIPYTGYVEGDTNFVDINPDDPMNDLEFVQITESVNVLGSDDIDKDSSFYVLKKQRNIPYEFLSHDGFSFSKYGDIYTLKDNSTKDELKFNGTLLKASENQLLKENRYSLLRWCENVADMSIVNIESLWDIYDSIYMSKNSIVESSSGFNNHDDYILYKLYTKYLEDTYGSVDTVNGISYDVTSFRRDNPDLKIGDLFSPVIIYNSLVKSFNVNGSSVLNNFMNNYEIRYSYILNNFDFIPFAYVDKESSGEDAHLWNGYIQNKSKYSGKFHDYFKNCGITEYLKLYSDGSEIYSTFNFSDVIEINRILSEEAAKVVDPLIGSPIDLTSRTYDIRYDDSVSKYIINIGGKEYYAQKIRNPKQSVEANVVAIEEMDTLYLALTDYLELMYMPGVIEDETFIAPGRRVKIEKFKGEADEFIGYYADKYGDPVMLNDSKVEFKVSDIVDSSSGSSGFYENVAKALAFDGRENTVDVNNEINKPKSEQISNLKDILSDMTSSIGESGLVTDKPELDHSVFFESINPILTFTSYKSSSHPGLDSMDVGNEAISPSLYYGLCLNTHAFATGLYTQWIDVDGDGGDVGSLDWWNGWLSDHGYYYYIDFTTLKNAMSGVYNVSLGELDDTIIFDLDVLKIINKDMFKTSYTGLQRLIRTATVLIGAFLLVYGLLMIACWLIDVNLVNGPGFLTIVTFGRLVAMRDTSEIPRISDGKTYVDFKYLLVFMIVLMIVGIVLITVDIHSIWDLIKRLFSGVFDVFSDLMFNR